MKRWTDISSTATWTTPFHSCDILAPIYHCARYPDALRHGLIYLHCSGQAISFDVLLTTNLALS
jgi:hypothetical protein